MSFPDSTKTRQRFADAPKLAPTIPHVPAPPPAMRLLQVVLEAMAGRRPLHQLRPHLERDAFLRLSNYVDAGVVRRLVLGRVHTQMPSQHAVEASVSLALGERWISCVARLDVRDKAWKCSELMILQPAALTR